MRFISFDDTVPTWGIETDAGIISGHRLLGGRHATLRSVIAAGDLDGAMLEVIGLEPDRRDVRRLPLIPDPQAVWCAGMNYAAHAAETGHVVAEAPRLFTRIPASLAAHHDDIIRPRVSTDFDFEGEIAVVIGQAGRHIAEDRALDHVAGYALFMDGSIRDWQKVTTTQGKNFWRTGAFGPGLVPASAVVNWREIELATRVNGIEVQRTRASAMLHSIPELIAYISRIAPLLPGDVVVTGTPEGIGCRRVPPLWLKPGDLVEVEGTGLGILQNRVADEAPVA